MRAPPAGAESPSRITITRSICKRAHRLWPVAQFQVHSRGRLALSQDLSHTSRSSAAGHSRAAGCWRRRRSSTQPLPPSRPVAAATYPCSPRRSSHAFVHSAHRRPGPAGATGVLGLLNTVSCCCIPKLPPCHTPSPHCRILPVAAGCPGRGRCLPVCSAGPSLVALGRQWHVRGW